MSIPTQSEMFEEEKDEALLGMLDDEDVEEEEVDDEALLPGDAD